MKENDKNVTVQLSEHRDCDIDAPSYGGHSWNER